MQIVSCHSLRFACKSMFCQDFAIQQSSCRPSHQQSTCPTSSIPSTHRQVRFSCLHSYVKYLSFGIYHFQQKCHLLNVFSIRRHDVVKRNSTYFPLGSCQARCCMPVQEPSIHSSQDDTCNACHSQVRQHTAIGRKWMTVALYHLMPFHHIVQYP